MIEERSTRSTISLRQRQLRQKLWPEYSDQNLWIRTVRNGFTTIPRTMPLIFQVMDTLSKGKPVSSTYFDLWCRAYDECFVVLNRHREMAFGAGFSGQRAEQTWQQRMETLAEYGFIALKAGPSGPFSYAILLNPYKVIEKLFKKNNGVIGEGLYCALVARAAEIGADDLVEEIPKPKPSTRKAAER